ncbi:hypothetical protein EVAR_53762_1 [Eumeta japonica]|uniref:Uncharacterized protein n=1 Tax=Eumeta variegata TaxID=151549 RepID=A0A4C1Z5F5_EUMVA|nr:hypothetical protein EVAR_53762_1 [Eumeta japonica]
MFWRDVAGVCVLLRAQIPGTKIIMQGYLPADCYIYGSDTIPQGYYVVRSSVMRTQRPALILIIKAYRSSSTHALPILAGVLPGDLVVVWRSSVDPQRS